MKILMVSSYLPFPLHSGGHIRLYNLIKELSKKHEITLVCEKRDKQTIEDVKQVAKYCKKVLTVRRKKQWSIKNIFSSGFSSKSFLVTGHTSVEMKSILENLLSSEKFDLIHVETFYVMQNIPQTKIPIVLAEHNIEFEVYQRFVDKSPFFLKPLLALDVMKIKNNEEHAWKASTKLLAVSDADKKQMTRTDVIVVPNGVDLETFIFKKPDLLQVKKSDSGLIKKEIKLLFIGDFKWMQNRDAVRWIISDIWPYLLRAIGNDLKIKLNIVGRNIPQSIKNLDTFDSISLNENSKESTYQIFNKADVLLAPIRIGGGSSYKIIEAMATGLPVITTTRGITGINAKADIHAITADDTQTIVEKTVKLLRDQELFAKIANNGRKLIEDNYNWKVIAKKLDEVYNSVIQ